SLDEKLMGMAAHIIMKADHDPDAKKVAEAISGIKGIYVRSYEFENENQYSTSDVEQIRAQVKGPGWSRLVGVRSKHAGENAEVYMLMPADKMLGLVIIAADPKRLTVINIIGTVDIDKLSDIDDDLNIPGIHLKREPTSSGN